MNKKCIIASIVTAVLLTVVAVAIGRHMWFESKKGSFMADLSDYYTKLGICVKFDLQYEIILSNGIEQITNISEGRDTQLRIDNYNTWVKWRKSLVVDIRPETETDPDLIRLWNETEKIFGTITLEDLYTHPNEIAEIYKLGKGGTQWREDVPSGPMSNYEVDFLFRQDRIIFDESTGKLIKQDTGDEIFTLQDIIRGYQPR